MPVAPSKAETAPPALVPLEIILSALPGILASLYRKYLTATFKSTITAGAFPVYFPSFSKVLPLAPGLATTYPFDNATSEASGFPSLPFPGIPAAPGIYPPTVFGKNIGALFALYFPTDLFLKYSSGI